MFQQLQVGVPTVAKHDLIAGAVGATRVETVLARSFVPRAVAGGFLVGFLVVSRTDAIPGFLLVPTLERRPQERRGVCRGWWGVVEEVADGAERPRGVERDEDGARRDGGVRPRPRAFASERAGKRQGVERGRGAAARGANLLRGARGGVHGVRDLEFGALGVGPAREDVVRAGKLRDVEVPRRGHAPRRLAEQVAAQPVGRGEARGGYVLERRDEVGIPRGASGAHEQLAGHAKDHVVGGDVAGRHHASPPLAHLAGRASYRLDAVRRCPRPKRGIDRAVRVDAPERPRRHRARVRAAASGRGAKRGSRVEYALFGAKHSTNQGLTE